MPKLIIFLVLIWASTASAQLTAPVPIPLEAPGGITQPALGTQFSSEEAQEFINTDCTAARIVAACPSQFCPDCVVLEYWQPIHAVVLVKRPGDRLITDADFGEFPGSLRPLGGGGGDNDSPHGMTNLHYYESRLYTMPQPFTIACQLCGRPEVFTTLNYVSDGDPHWVTAELTKPPLINLDTILPLGLGPLGVWGPLVPLGGHHVHSSMTVAAAATAAKTLWVAADPTSLIDRNVNVPGELSTCFQPAWPIKMPCMRVGFPPPLWDFAHITPEGKYLFFFWARRVCCMPVDQTVCALAASGQGQNFCDIPPLPAAAGLAATIAIFGGLGDE